MRRSASFIFAEPSPILRASSMVGSSQKLASPSGWLTWMCLRLSSRKKKKNLNSPSRKTVGDKQAPPLAFHHSLASPSEKGKSSCSRSDTFRPRALRIRLSASFQRWPSPARKEPQQECALGSEDHAVAGQVHGRVRWRQAYKNQHLASLRCPY